MTTKAYTQRGVHSLLQSQTAGAVDDEDFDETMQARRQGLKRDQPGDPKQPVTFTSTPSRVHLLPTRARCVPLRLTGNTLLLLRGIIS